jgi:hypothetical protein
MYLLLTAIAQFGDCLDCRAIEGRLRTLGYSAAEAREALSDAEDRAALLVLCVSARTPARQLQRMRDDAASRTMVGSAD